MIYKSEREDPPRSRGGSSQDFALEIGDDLAEAKPGTSISFTREAYRTVKGIEKKGLVTVSMAKNEKSGDAVLTLLGLGCLKIAVSQRKVLLSIPT